MGTDAPGTSSHGDRDEWLSTTGVASPRLCHLRSVPVPHAAMSSQLQGTQGTAAGQRTGLWWAWLRTPATGSHGDPRAHDWAEHGRALRRQSGGTVTYQCLSIAGGDAAARGVSVARARGSQHRCARAHPEPSPEPGHRQEMLGSSCLRLVGATWFLTMKKATKHRDGAPASCPGAPSRC